MTSMERLQSVGVALLHRFFWGWYGVEQRLSHLEAILKRIEASVGERCPDCPKRGKEKR